MARKKGHLNPEAVREFSVDMAIKEAEVIGVLPYDYKYDFVIDRAKDISYYVFTGRKRKGVRKFRRIVDNNVG